MALSAVLMATNRKYTRYVESCVNVLGEYWPGHPRLIVLTDEAVACRAEVKVTERPEWVDVVEGGLAELCGNGVGSDDYVLLILEDQIPTSRVGVGVVDELAHLAASRDLGLLSLFPDRRMLGELIGRAVGFDVHEIKPDYEFYSPLQPGIWRAGHLLRLLRIAQETGKRDPWSFERLRVSDVVHTAVHEPFWPCEFGGFLTGGRINLSAVRKMTGSETRELRWRLRYDWMRSLPLRARRSLVRRLRAAVIRG